MIIKNGKNAKKQRKYHFNLMNKIETLIKEYRFMKKAMKNLYTLTAYVYKERGILSNNINEENKNEIQKKI